MTFIIIGFIAGILSGLFGIGGGVIIVPALVMFAGLEQKMANGVSIASLLLPVGVLGVIKYHKENYVKVKESLTIGLGLLTGTYFGAWFAMSLPSKQLKYFYAFFLLFVAYRFIKKSGVVINNEDTPPRPIFMFFMLGCFAGVLSGLFGIGGGVVIVPILMSFFKMNTKQAAGTSLGALLLPVGLFGVMKYYQEGFIQLIPAAQIAISLAIGVFIGAHFAMKIPNKKMKQLYGVFLILVAIKFIV